MLLLVFLVVVLISSGALIIWNILLLRNYEHKNILESKKTLWFYTMMGIFGVFLSTLMIVMFVIV